MTAHLLMSLTYTLFLLSFIKKVLYSIPFMVGFFLRLLPSSSASLLTSSLLNCMDCPVSNTPCWYLSSGKLEWVFFLVLPSVPYWCMLILLSLSVPSSDSPTSWKDIPFTSSVNFSSLPFYSTFNVIGLWQQCQRSDWLDYISLPNRYKVYNSFLNINTLRNSNSTTFY